MEQKKTFVFFLLFFLSACFFSLLFIQMQNYKIDLRLFGCVCVCGWRFTQLYALPIGSMYMRICVYVWRLPQWMPFLFNHHLFSFKYTIYVLCIYEYIYCDSNVQILCMIDVTERLVLVCIYNSSIYFIRLHVWMK